MQSAKKVITTLLKGIVTVAVIAVLVFKLGWNDIRSIVLTAKPLWLSMALAVFIASTLLGVIQWRVLLANRGIPLRLGRSCRLYMIGMFFNNFVLGGIVGDVLKIASIRSRDGKGMAGFAATLLDRFAGLWAMCGFAVAGSLVLFHHGTVTTGKVGTAVIALFAAFLLFAAILAFLISKRLQRVVFFLLDRIPSAKRLRLHEMLSEMIIEAHDRHILLSVAALSTLIQFLRITVHIMVAASLGLCNYYNFHYFFIFVPIIAMLMTLPLPFGVREAAGGTLFAFAGFPQDAAYVMGFLATLVGLAGSLIGGLFYITDRTVSMEQQ